MKSYKLKTSEDGVKWIDVEDGKEFPATKENKVVVSNILRVPIQCKAIRIYPSTSSNTAADLSTIFKSEIILIVWDRLSIN